MAPAGQDSLPEEDLKVLTGAGFFRGVEGGVLAELLSGSTRREYRRRDVIADPEEGRGRVFLVSRGLARLDRLSPEGSWLTVEMLGPGDLHGAAHAAAGVQIKSLMIAVVNGTVVYHVPATLLRTMIQGRPKLTEQALGIAYERLARAFDLAAALHQQPIPVRLARLLCKIAKTSPDHVVHETHEDLAGLIGASREAVTRVLSDLRKRGLVESLRHRPGLHVPDPDQLQDVVEGEFR